MREKDQKPKNRKKAASIPGGARKLVIGEDAWYWMDAGTFGTVIWTPDKKKYQTGFKFDKPRDVRFFIDTKFLGKELSEDKNIELGKLYQLIEGTRKHDLTFYIVYPKPMDFTEKDSIIESIMDYDFIIPVEHWVFNDKDINTNDAGYFYRALLGEKVIILKTTHAYVWGDFFRKIEDGYETKREKGSGEKYETFNCEAAYSRERI